MCAQGRKDSTLGKLLNVYRKECVQGSLKDSEVVMLRRYRTFELSPGEA
jgi:hypothetical protein